MPTPSGTIIHSTLSNAPRCPYRPFPRPHLSINPLSMTYFTANPTQPAKKTKPSKHMSFSFSVLKVIKKHIAINTKKTSKK